MSIVTKNRWLSACFICEASLGADEGVELFVDKLNKAEANAGEWAPVLCTSCIKHLVTELEEVSDESN